MSKIKVVVVLAVEDIILRNKSTKEVVNLSKMTTEDYVLDLVDWGTVQSTHHTYKFVNQVGEYVNNTTLGTRNVEIVAWVIADSEEEMTQRKSKLNGFINPQQAIELFYKDYKIEFLPDTSIAFSTSIKENNEVVSKFKINGMCPDPLFSDRLENQVTVASRKGMFKFPLIIPLEPEPAGVIFGLREPSLIASLENKGSVETGIQIIFVANGLVVNPTIINVKTQEYITIEKELNYGEQVTINTNIGSKSVRGLYQGEELNYFKYRKYGSSWLQLSIGENLFRYDAEENVDNLEVYIYHSNKYIEVQEWD